MNKNGYLILIWDHSPFILWVLVQHILLKGDMVKNNNLWEWGLFSLRFVIEKLHFGKKLYVHVFRR